MKRAHRSAHRLIWLILAPLLALIIWLAVTERVEAPVEQSLPSDLQEGAD